MTVSSVPISLSYAPAPCPNTESRSASLNALGRPCASSASFPNSFFLASSRSLSAHQYPPAITPRYDPTPIVRFFTDTRIVSVLTDSWIAGYVDRACAG